MTDPIAQRLADATLDRRRLKRRLVWWRASSIVAIAASIAAVVFFQGGHDTTWDADASYIARVPIIGVIEDSPATEAHLLNLAENPGIAGVILNINSPGGTFSGSEALYESLRKLAMAKPTAAVVGGMAASGAYMAAVASDHIVARSGSIVGSVGVIFQMPQLHRLLNDIGIDMETVRSGDLKAVPGPTQETTPEARKATEGLVDDLFQQFIGIVVERRDLDAAALEDVKRGGVYTGRRGLTLGLIDGIGGEEAALQWLETEHDIAENVPVVDRPVSGELPWWEEALDQLENRVRLGPTPIFDGPWAIWHQ